MSKKNQKNKNSEVATEMPHEPAEIDESQGQFVYYQSNYLKFQEWEKYHQYVFVYHLDFQSLLHNFQNFFHFEYKNVIVLHYLVRQIVLVVFQHRKFLKFHHDKEM